MSNKKRRQASLVDGSKLAAVISSIVNYHTSAELAWM